MIRKGDKVTIGPEWQDAGDDQFAWLAVEDEDGGRVRIECQNGAEIRPTQVVETRMLIEGSN